MSKRAEYRRAIKELKVMILLGEGRWLNEKPISCGNKKIYRRWFGVEQCNQRASGT